MRQRALQFSPTVTTPRCRGWPFVLAGLLAVAACGGDSTGPGGTLAPPTALAFITAPATSVPAFATLDPKPVVELRDARNHPVKKAGVTIVAALGGGATSGVATVNTDASGRAQFTSLSLSGAAGPHELSFSSTGLTTLTHALVLTAGAATRLQARSSVAQSAVAGTLAAEPPSVLVTDNADNPVSGVAVAFTVTGGGGTLTGGNPVSDAAGVATVTSWTLGSDPGPNTVSAALPAGGTPVVFSATGLATVILTRQSDNMDGEVNQPASAAPSVLVTDTGGAPLAGVTVTFAVPGAAGSIASPVQVSDAAGIATSGSWTLGTTAGPQTATASAPGALPVSFSATARPGPASSLVVTGGNNQSAVIWHRVPVDPTVTVRDQFGNAVPAGTILFQVNAGGGTVATGSVPVASDGSAATPWSLGRSPGANGLSASLTGSAVPAVSFSATALPPTSAFNIDVRYIGSPTPAQKTAVSEAVQRWRVIISGDLPSQAINLPAGTCAPNQPAINETIDDVVIFAELAGGDGPGGVLGSAGPCVLRSAGGLPSLGYIQLDPDDLATMDQVSLNDLLLHEMGHVLGFGTLWPDKGLLIGACPETGACSTDPQYTGSAGIDGYHALGGQQANVPVEETGGEGTANSHWRESVFFEELMTGFLDLGGDPLTAMTIGSIQDLGYQVDYASAEPLGFTVSFARARVARSSPLRERQLQSPVIVMDAGGKITGRRPRR